MSRLGEAILVFCVIIAVGIYAGQHVSCTKLWPLTTTACIFK